MELRFKNNMSSLRKERDEMEELDEHPITSAVTTLLVILFLLLLAVALVPK